MNAFYCSKKIRAKKIHRCGDCGGCISIGEFYIKIATKDSYDFFSIKRCLVCEDLWGIVCGYPDYDSDDCITSLSDYLRDYAKTSEKNSAARNDYAKYLRNKKRNC